MFPRFCGKTKTTQTVGSGWWKPAKRLGAPFLTLSDVVIEEEDLDLLLETLREQNFPDEEAPEFEEIEALCASMPARVAFLQLGFVHQGVAFVHETASEWYYNYESLVEAIEEFGSGGVMFEEDGEEEE